MEPPARVMGGQGQTDQGGTPEGHRVTQRSGQDMTLGSAADPTPPRPEPEIVTEDAKNSLKNLVSAVSHRGGPGLAPFVLEGPPNP